MRGITVVAIIVMLAFTSISDVTRPWHLDAPRTVAKCLNDIGISPGSFDAESGDDLHRDLAESRNVGATRLRFDIDWSSIEAVRGVYDWSHVDDVVKAIVDAQLTPLAVLSYTPDWARVPGATDSHGAPADPRQFAKFAADAVERYGSIIQTWEIWNEPNIDMFWSPTPNAKAYVDLVRATSAAIRDKQPNATILVGALSSGADANYGEIDPETFVSEMYAAGASGTFDALSVHPYTFPALPTDPDPDGTNTFRKLPRLHAIMASNGDGEKNIWITEFGAPTGTDPSAVTQVGQAENLSTGILAARSLGYVPVIFIYSIRDSGTDARDLYQNFGLLTHSFARKRAFQEVKILTASTDC